MKHSQFYSSALYCDVKQMTNIQVCGHSDLKMSPKYLIPKTCQEIQPVTQNIIREKFKQL